MAVSYSKSFVMYSHKTHMQYNHFQIIPVLYFNVLRKEGRGHWAVNYLGTYSFVIMLSHSLA